MRSPNAAFGGSGSIFLRGLVPANTAGPSTNSAVASTINVDTQRILPTRISLGLAYVRNAKPVMVEDKGTEPFVASPTTVSTEDYPLARRLYLYTTASTSETVRRFVDFVLSSERQRILMTFGFLPR